MPNVYEPEFDVERDEPPYVWRRARVGAAAGARALGASVFAVPPGGTTFPLHAHLHNEELLVVLAGEPTLRVGGDVPIASWRPARSSRSSRAWTARTSSATTAPRRSGC